jgi:DNA polymerase-1
MDVFIKGRNLHDETAKALFGENYTKQQKMRAKAVNFGIPYGREAQSFVDEYQIGKEEASEMISGWLNKYPGARDYLKWCADQVVAGNFLETPFGRRRRFGLVTPESLHALQNEARNFPIQSSSSDLLLVSAMKMEKHLLDEYDTRILNLVHDSLLLEIPAKVETIMAVGSYANNIMVTAPVERFNCPVPFKTDFEIGLSWGELITFNYDTGTVYKEENDTTVEFYEWYQANL